MSINVCTYFFLLKQFKEQTKEGIKNKFQFVVFVGTASFESSNACMLTEDFYRLV